jgi:hypothetical protein
MMLHQNMHLVLAEKNNTPNAVQKLEQAKPASETTVHFSSYMESNLQE